MAATIEDVAAAAEVSTATVSRALRGLPDVASPTRERVLHAAAELRYVPDPRAASLASGRTGGVGVAVPGLERDGNATLVAAAEAVCRAAGHDLLLYDVPVTGARDRFLAELPFRKRVDGLLLVDLGLADEEVDRLRRAGTPFVLVGQRGPECPGVLVDHDEAARTATEHLLGLGHHRVGLVVPAAGDDAGSWVAALRDGYRAALVGRGLQADPRLEAAAPPSGDAGEALRRLSEAAEPPTAVLAASDELAVGVLERARHRGLAVPGDLSVVGYGDRELAELLGLTSVTHPVREQGERSAILLFELLRGAASQQVVTLPARRLQARATTGPPGPPRSR